MAHGTRARQGFTTGAATPSPAHAHAHAHTHAHKGRRDRHSQAFPMQVQTPPPATTPRVNFEVLNDVRLTALHSSIAYPWSEQRASELSQSSSRTISRIAQSRLVQWLIWVLFALLLVLGLSMQFEAVSSGMLWGNVLSCISLSIVILHYTMTPKTRRHPNQLLFWRAIADMIFTFQLLAQQFTSVMHFEGKALCDDASAQCGCSYDPKASATCHVFAGVFEFSIFAAEGWYLAMMINLYWSLSNPFADFKRNNRLFHRVTWGSAAIMGIVLATSKDWAGYSDLGVCWTNALRHLTPETEESCPLDVPIIDKQQRLKAVANSLVLSGGFFTVWIALSIVTGLWIWTWTWRRLRDGAPKSLQVRAQSIQRAHVSVTAVTIYWVVLVCIDAMHIARGYTPDGILFKLLTFAVAGKGFVDLVIWIHVMYCADRSMGDEYQAMAPQMNSALQEEVIHYTTTGIQRAVEECHHIPRSATAQKFQLDPPSRTIRLSSDGTIFASGLSDMEQDTGNRGWWSRSTTAHHETSETFHDYEPHSFRAIRELFKVTDEAYTQSILEPTKVQLSEGASGAFMFFTTDKALIVKSMTASECKFLRSIAPSYSAYLQENPRSLLTRFYGCHCLEMYGSKFYFVVMANLFNTEVPIHYRYDIKGSTIGRRARLPKIGEKATCRNCNQRYEIKPYGMRDDCPVGVRGNHEPEVVLKDLDLLHKLKLDENEAADLFVRLQKDADQLREWKIMDYSLLLGIHEGQYFVNAPSRGSRTARPPTVLEPPPPEPPLMRHVTSEAQLRRRAFAQFPRTTLNVDAAPAEASHGSHGSDPANCSKCQESSDAILRAKVVVGPMYYYVGVIDILQTWTFKKRLEHFFKVFIKGDDRMAISAIPVEPYHDRFVATLKDILDVREAHMVDNKAPLPVALRLGVCDSSEYSDPYPPQPHQSLHDTAFFV